MWRKADFARNLHESKGSSNASPCGANSSSFSDGSSGSFGIGNLLVEPTTSPCSQTGEVVLDVKDELPLGNLECPRTEKVGVGGPDTSEALDEKEPAEECAQSVVLIVRSSVD